MEKTQTKPLETQKRKTRETPQLESEKTIMVGTGGEGEGMGNGLIYSREIMG